MAVIITAKRYENEINEVREIVNEFSEDMEIDDVLYYATSEWGFRIPHEADRKLWNKIIDRLFLRRHRLKQLTWAGAGFVPGRGLRFAQKGDRIVDEVCAICQQTKQVRSDIIYM